MKKENNAETTEENISVKHKNIGEQIFIIIIFLTLIGIIGFYISLPLHTTAYYASLDTEHVTIDSVMDSDHLTQNQTDNEGTDHAEDELTDGADGIEPSDTTTNEPPTSTDNPNSNPADDSNQPTTDSLENFDRIGVVTIQYDGLNVREGSTVNTAAIGKAYSGEQYDLLELLTDINWAKINFNGEIAYVHSDFIEISYD